MKLTRFRGDTQAESFVLNQDGTPIDLASVTRVEFAFVRKDGVRVIEAVKDVDPLTGLVIVNFTDADVDTAGEFAYDIQVYWTDSTKTTFVKAIIEFTQDINKG